MITLMIIRGLPGSGKTTLAKTLTDHVFSADDYFIRPNGSFLFDPELLVEAHDACFQRVKARLHQIRMADSDSLSASERIVAVANVFAKKSHITPYANLAGEVFAASGFQVFVMDLFNQNFTDTELSNRTIHGVPVSTIIAMRRGWEH